MPPADVDAYLAALPADQRRALAGLRALIRAAAPDAQECISYRIPCYKQHGMLVGFAAAARHCSFCLLDGTSTAAHAADLKAYHTSKGTIRFTPDKPLPPALVRKLVRARLAENAARAADRPATPAKPAKPAARTDPAVDALLLKLDHPLKPQLQALRRLILAVSPAVREELKWNSPSFKTTDHFATANTHGASSLRLILHRGAKKRTGPMPDIPDPAGLLTWLGKDRALITLDSAAALRKASAPLKTLLKHWIRTLGT